MPPYRAGYGQRKTPWSTPFRPRSGRIATRAGASRAARTGAARGAVRAAAGELKYHDLDVDDASISAAGTLSPTLCAIPQNGTATGRLGRKCTVVGIAWRYTLTMGLSASVQIPETVRLMIILDKQTNGAAFTPAQVLETDAYQSFNQLDNKDRFRVLMDRVIDMNSVAAAGDGVVNDSVGNNLSGVKYIKCKIPIEYDATTNSGLIATQRSNGLHVMILSQQGGRVSIVSKVRLRFTDN